MIRNALQKIRMTWGLTWEGSTMPVNVRLLVDAIALVIMLVLAYGMVEYVSSNAKLADANAVAVHRAAQAELNLAHCLNGLNLRTDGGMIMCEKAFWVDIYKGEKS